MPRLTTALAAGLLAVTLGLRPAGAADDKKDTGDLLKKNGQFERGSTTANEWGGIDNNDKIRTMPQRAPVVLTSGRVYDVDYPSSLGVGDLNGDKLPDLIVADATGYFWFYPNKGTAKEPAFDYGQIIPFWLTPRRNNKENEGNIRAVNKIDLTDFNDDGKLDLVVGNFMGQIFLAKNTGSSQTAKFDTPSDLTKAAVATADKGLLWGNFFAPVYYDWDGDNRRDLIIGDGTYATNNIFLLPNKGTNDNPRFATEERIKLINGLGKEHLTPRLVDWNADGKMDVLTGEREGNVTVYLNKGGDKMTPEFEEVQVKFGSSSRLGQLSSALPVDMNGDGLFDLLTTQTNGRVAMALNTGKKGAPKFDRPKDLTGKNPYPKYKRPAAWNAQVDDQYTFWLFRLVGTEEKDPLTYESGLTLPGGSKYAAKFEFIKPLGPTYKDKLAPPEGERPSRLDYAGTLKLKPDTKYTVSWRMKGSGFTKPQVRLYNREKLGNKWVDYTDESDIRLNSSWSDDKWTFSFKREKGSPKMDAPGDFKLSFSFLGEGTVYLDNVEVKEN